MSNTPLVSIVVPIYNSEKWLPLCIQSLLNQSHPNIEIILIDDGSEDESGALCSHFARNYQNIVYISQPNLGVSAARNRGIEKSQGEYLLFVDSDDWVDSKYVASLVKEAEKTQADYVLSGYVRNFIATKTKDFLIPKAMTFDVADTVAEERFLCLFESRLLYAPFTGLYRKRIIRSNEILFPKDVQYGEDRIFNLKYLSRCKRISTICEAHYHYRIENDDSLSHIQDKDELLHIRRLFSENKNFLRTMRYNSSAFLSWLYTPLYDAYSNQIIRYATIYRDSSWMEIYKNIKSYLHDPDLREGYTYASLDKYPRFLVFLMKYHCAFLLSLLSFRSRKHPL